MKVKANNPAVVADIAMQDCGSADPTLIGNFMQVMNMEDSCQGSLWDDGDYPGNTDDDNVMMYLCDAPFSYTDENNNVVNTSMVQFSRQQYPSQASAIDCTLNPPNGDVTQCCAGGGGGGEPVWNS